MKKFEKLSLYRLFCYSWIIGGHLALLYLIIEGQWFLIFLSLMMNYLISQVGISLTYHRAVSHKSIKLPTWIEFVGSLIGGLSLQGSPLSWAIVHRTHHKHTASEKDPHSPKFLGSLYLHTFGYVFSSYDNKLAIDLVRSWHLTFHKIYYYLYATILFSSFLFLDFNLALALFWAPIAIVFQFESFVNTWLHGWKKDTPSNIMFVQLFVGGESYHKNHHDKPGNFRFGKFDLIGFFGEKFLK